MKNVKRIAAVLLAVLVILTTFAACSSPEKDIIGVWKDSTGMTGYEFKEGGLCTVTLLDIPTINLGSNGGIEGTYTVTKKEDENYYVTVTYTLLYTSVTDEFMFTVEDSVLTLTRVNDDGTFGSPVAYMAYTADTTTTAAAQ
ncbi:MAG: hypothetical protein IJ491_07655 [Clostridia bacterium]|nr:hypothetical protein [Clostridia bacterium]